MWPCVHSVDLAKGVRRQFADGDWGSGGNGLEGVGGVKFPRFFYPLAFRR